MDTFFLSNTLLFRGAAEKELTDMLKCLDARERTFQKGEVLLSAGEGTRHMGLVLFGSVSIEIDDVWGNTSLIGRALPGQIFAETYACMPGEPMLVQVTAAEKCAVLFLDAAKVMTTCPSACTHHNRLVKNLLQISAQKNLSLSRRILHTTPKSIRGRLLSYLSEQARLAGSSRFHISLNRRQLADYLGVDRSALSNELSKMQRDGLLTYRKNDFELRERV